MRGEGGKGGSLTDRLLHGNTLTGALGYTTSTRHLHSLLRNTHFVLLLIRVYHVILQQQGLVVASI